MNKKTIIRVKIEEITSEAKILLFEKVYNGFHGDSFEMNINFKKTPLNDIGSVIPIAHIDLGHTLEIKAEKNNYELLEHNK